MQVSFDYAVENSLDIVSILGGGYPKEVGGRNIQGREVQREAGGGGGANIKPQLAATGVSSKLGTHCATSFLHCGVSNLMSTAINYIAAQ